MASSLGSVSSSGSVLPSPVNSNAGNAGNAPGNPNAQAVAQQALAGNQPQPPQGQNPALNFSNIGDQVNNQGNGQDPNQPSPFMMIVSMVAKYAIPALLVIGGFVAVGVSLSVAGTTAAIATPFLLLTGGVLLMGIGMGFTLKALVNDFAKDMQIRELGEALRKEQEKKANVSSVDALKKKQKNYLNK